MYALYGHPKYFKFKGKYQPYGPLFPDYLSVSYDYDGNKFLNPLEQRMVDCVYYKAANCTCSRDVSRTTAVSEIEFFIIPFL